MTTNTNSPDERNEFNIFANRLQIAGIVTAIAFLVFYGSNSPGWAVGWMAACTGYAIDSSCGNIFRTVMGIFAIVYTVQLFFGFSLFEFLF